MTLEAWVKPTIVSGTRYPIISARSVNTTGAWQFEIINTSGYSRALYVTSTSVNHYLTSTNILTDGVWQHVVYTRAGASATGKQRFYLNGVQITAIDIETPTDFVDNANPIYIGNGTLGQFRGQIDEVRVWNVVRSQDEIRRDMYRELTGTENGLVGYWKFDENDGCTAYDETSNNNDGARDPTCASNAPNWSTDIPTLNNQNPDLPPGTITNSRGGWLYSGRVVANTNLTINKVDYSVNGSGFAGATATDGAFNANGENYEVLFQSNDNGNTYPGYILEVKATDSTDKTGKRTHFEPFNLSSIRKLSDGQLEFTFNVNKQRNLMKDRLDRYKIIYSQDSSSDKLLLDDIAIDFESVRSKLQNQADNEITCDPCVYDNHKMKVTYSGNNSQLTVLTKKAPTLTGSTTFKVIAINPDKFEENSNNLTLESSSSGVRSSADQLTSASQESVKPEEEPGEKKLPGQKTNFETTTGGETGPVAAIINGVISTILGIWEKIGSMLPKL